MDIITKSKTITVDDANSAMVKCCGENATDLSKLSETNVIQYRNQFLNNVRFNGSRSHEEIIVVLQYMSQFIPKENKRFEFF